MNEVGEFGMGYGQQIRLEVHGQCAELPTIKAIMDIADHENVTVCWNSNRQDLLVQTDYAGWVLLEAATKPADRVAALAEQRNLFDRMVRNARTGSIEGR